MKFLVLISLLFVSVNSFAKQVQISPKEYKAQFKDKSNALGLGVRTLSIELCVCKNVLKESDETCLAETFETQPVPASIYDIEYGTTQDGKNYVSTKVKLVGTVAVVTYDEMNTCVIRENKKYTLSEKVQKSYQVVKDSVKKIKFW